MKLLLFLLLEALVIAATNGSTTMTFEQFKKHHGKAYKNRAEEVKRQAIYKENLNLIEEHNALYDKGHLSYKLGITKFADLTSDEFQAKIANQVLQKLAKVNGTETFKLADGVTVPDTMDWRNKSVVTGVKDQGECGACWAFSLTGSTESAHAIKTGKLVSLSEQQLIDCTTSVNEGCDGGYLEETFPYIKQKGLESESSYVYTAEDGTCKYNSGKVVTHITSYVTILNNENKLKDAVGTVGPVSVSLNANDLQLYTSGIFDNSKCSTTLNHGVLIVGYGSEDDKNYWIVKNSWGTDWGEDGYFRIIRGNNECGISEDTVYPKV